MDKSRLRNPHAGSDRVRLIAMGVLLILVAAIFVFTRLTVKDRQSAMPHERFVPAFTANAPPAALIRPELLTEVEDDTAAQRITKEHGAFLHLIQESAKLVAGDFRRLDTVELDDVHDEVMANPTAYRGQPFSARGFFAFAQKKTLAIDPERENEPGITYYEGLVQDDMGRQFSFSMLEEPEDIEPGQIVRVRGFFLKKLSLFDPDDTAQTIDSTLHVVGKRVVRSFYRMESVLELSPSVISTIRDYEIEDQLRLEDEVLYHAISYVQNEDADALARQADDRTAFELRTNPAEFRGQPVRVLGTFFKTWPQHLGPGGENPLDLSTVWHGLLVHAGPSFTYLVCPEREPEWTRDRDTNVIVEGVFLKRHSYQARSGEVVSTPLIVVKRFVPFVVDTSSVNKLLSVGSLSVAAVLLIWFGYSTFSDRRANAQFRQRYYARKKKQVGKLVRDSE